MVPGKLVRRAVATAAVAVAALWPVPASAAGGRVLAVGAENEYANVIAQVGGRYVTVDAIMSNPNTDPHTFEASPSVASEVAAARLVVQNGVGYDTFMSRLEAASPNPRRRVIVVQDVLGLATDTPNPHLWYGPATMPEVASAVERDLAALDPAHATYFARRLAAFTSSVAALSASYAAFKSRFAGRAVATTEPVADDLLRALGLRDLTPFSFQADIMNGVDPSPQDVATEETLITTHRVAMLCYNAQVVSPVTLSIRSLAQADHVPVVAVYETMPAGGFDYQTWMAAELAAIQRALVDHRSTTVL